MFDYHKLKLENDCEEALIADGDTVCRSAGPDDRRGNGGGAGGQGATEGTVKNQTAEAIADITSTGSTLVANHLKPLADGPILRSQATVFLSHQAEWGSETKSAYAALAKLCDWTVAP